eukprot:CAMPEP_0204013140 /NCGR_PEP_ID=MMETSP0360-20130528/24499_1 /ASSEMBLY_ACC=CAM_ASM_000342 /TAXON_ID=268821 /ORGANISM="Scrippsiella Hangoei, Strain SHTV-5" /LENGTH=37 /DNA_ID= /DNA_START= /DNA_END= /DNA_ORIENTATION=
MLPNERAVFCNNCVAMAKMVQAHARAKITQVPGVQGS